MAKISMDQLTGNSHKSKESTPAPTMNDIPSIKQVAQGKIKKQTLGKKLKTAFIAEDIKTVKSYALDEVVIPGVKDLMLAILHNSIDMIFTGHGSKRKSSGFYGSHNNYGSYYSKKSEPIHQEKVRTYETVGFDTKDEADEVLEQMRLYLDEYHRVSIATFNEAAGVTGEYTDNRYGWRSLEGAKVMYHQGEWFIDFPKPKDLNL